MNDTGGGGGGGNGWVITDEQCHRIDTQLREGRMDGRHGVMWLQLSLQPAQCLNTVTVRNLTVTFKNDSRSVNWSWRKHGLCVCVCGFFLKKDLVLVYLGDFLQSAAAEEVDQMNKKSSYLQM